LVVGGVSELEKWKWLEGRSGGWGGGNPLDLKGKHEGSPVVKE